MPEMSEHFSYKEMTETDTGLDNTPNSVQLEALQRLAEFYLEPMRSIVGPMKVHAFRTQAVNNAIPHSSKKSQHMLGQAADVVPLRMPLEKAFALVKASLIPYDQLIIEPGWIHISMPTLGKTPRRQCLRAKMVGDEMKYFPA